MPFCVATTIVSVRHFQPFFTGHPLSTAIYFEESSEALDYLDDTSPSLIGQIWPSLNYVLQITILVHAGCTLFVRRCARVLLGECGPLLIGVGS